MAKWVLAKFKFGDLNPYTAIGTSALSSIGECLIRQSINYGVCVWMSNIYFLLGINSMHKHTHTEYIDMYMALIRIGAQDA